VSIRENIVRNYIRKKMFKHKLEDVFKMIQEEYSRVYYEDNFFDRKHLLQELVDKTMPEEYKHLV
jgi:hypothetical protein